ncbi:hypothetical protein [Denitratisoma oestradiolicum]|nr:hypothetical protein [Denitratisoma oestradiolicum]
MIFPYLKAINVSNVIPAQAGIQNARKERLWIPGSGLSASPGMTRARFE